MEDIDLSKVHFAAQQASLDEIIDSWPSGYETEVGENGVKLSGGQRQRIGIARALYKDSEVLILDEATSALDNMTESSVMKSIDSLSQDLTILIIAHRVTTLNGCDFIVELDNGAVARIGSYKNILDNPIK